MLSFILPACISCTCCQIIDDLLSCRCYCHMPRGEVDQQGEVAGNSLVMARVLEEHLGSMHSSFSVTGYAHPASSEPHCQAEAMYTHWYVSLSNTRLRSAFFSRRQKSTDNEEARSTRCRLVHRGNWYPIACYRFLEGHLGSIDQTKD